MPRFIKIEKLRSRGSLSASDPVSNATHASLNAPNVELQYQASSAESSSACGTSRSCNLFPISLRVSLSSNRNEPYRNDCAT